MPRRQDIKKVLLIGSGPIVIGQACEFDYSGAQAIKALKDEGIEVVLLNSNPATIMTDPDFAHRTYLEPITVEAAERIIQQEKPDSLLPTMGGQTALNLAKALAEQGILEKYGVRLIGADLKAINMAEDRDLFRAAMSRIGLAMPKSGMARSMDEARVLQKEMGLPTIIRPSFTLGGTGGGIAYTLEEFEAIAAGGLAASPVGSVLIEESVLGWKEYELEVVRDTKDNCIIVCSIENLDAMGVHTGDSITVAPAQTLTDKEYQRLRDASFAIMREIGVETGGSNVQFGINPKDGRLVVIEMNPRVSRSSALASKATGYPIAKIAAKLAVGYTLDELKNDITRDTVASFEPTIDYVVVKVPRFNFEKFAGSSNVLGTMMRSVGDCRQRPRIPRSGADKQASETSDHERSAAILRLFDQGQVREPGDEPFERHRQLLAGERGADTEVDAATEPDVGGVATPDVEPVGSSKRRGSRSAEPNSITTSSPTCIGCPASSTSGSSTHRSNSCSGASQRSSSSIAVLASTSPVTNRAHSAGCLISARTPLPSVFTVAS